MLNKFIRSFAVEFSAKNGTPDTWTNAQISPVQNANVKMVCSVITILLAVSIHTIKSVPATIKFLRPRRSLIKPAGTSMMTSANALSDTTLPFTDSLKPSSFMYILYITINTPIPICVQKLASI